MINKLCYVAINVVMIWIFIDFYQEIIKKSYIILINELFCENKTHVYVYKILLVVFFNI